jgi:hypothetical protein
MPVFFIAPELTLSAARSACMMGASGILIGSALYILATTGSAAHLSSRAPRRQGRVRHQIISRPTSSETSSLSTACPVIDPGFAAKKVFSCACGRSLSVSPKFFAWRTSATVRAEGRRLGKSIQAHGGEQQTAENELYTRDLQSTSATRCCSPARRRTIVAPSSLSASVCVLWVGGVLRGVPPANHSAPDFKARCHPRSRSCRG